MTNSVQQYLRYANVQMAAESLFGLTSQVEAVGELNQAILNIEVLEAGNRHASRFTTSQATQFLNEEGWQVVRHQQNTSTGFSGTLLSNGTEQVLSFRSTEFIDDSIRDNQATNALEIKEFGWAFGQISDMRAWVADLYAKGEINPDLPLTITGYSLGGHLATAFRLLFPTIPAATYTFNGAGVGFSNGFISSVIDQFDQLRQSSDLVSLFTNPGARQLYSDIRLQLTKGQSLSDAEFNSIFQSVSNLRALSGGSEPSTIPIVDPDVDLLYHALDRIRIIRGEIGRISTFQSSASGGTPLVNISQPSIEATSLNYQLAVLVSARNTSAASIASGAIQMLVRREVTPPIPNFYEIFGAPLPSAVANSQLHHGTAAPVFIEDQPIWRGSVIDDAIAQSWAYLDVKLLVDNYGQNDFGDTHSLVLLVDSLSVQNILVKLDKDVSQETLNSILKAATNAKRAGGGTDNQGFAEGDALEKVLDGVRKMLLGPDVVSTPFDMSGGTWANEENRKKFHENIAGLTTTNAFLALSVPGTVKVSSVAGADLGRMARTDFSAFVALQTLSPVYLTSVGSNSGVIEAAIKNAWGDDYSKWSADKGAVANGGSARNFTDTYLADRQALLQWIQVANLENIANGISILNRTTADPYVKYEDFASGRTIRIGGAVDEFRTQVLFGDSSSNTLTGYGLNDRLYGGGGNDYLAGKIGSDHLEGGLGNDTLVGGSGNDILLGGDGLDRYVFERKWGYDSVDDVDGNAIIDVADFGVITGAGLVKTGAGSWQSEDKRVTVTEIEREGGKKDLVILFSGRSDSIILRNWTGNGSYGITLGSSVEEPAPSNLRGDFKKKVDPNDPSRYLIGSDGNYVFDSASPGTADLITGTANGDVIDGLLGDDALLGRGGDDLINGGAGNDVLMGGRGRDTLNGGDGADHIYGSSQGALFYPTNTNYVPASPRYGTVVARGFTWSASANGRDSDGLYATYIDTTVGRELASVDEGNIIDGGAGEDHIYAGAGSDTVHGGSDADDITGMGGDDVLFGDAGSDRIDGDGPDDLRYVTHTPAEYHGRDHIQGGTGNDTLAGQGGDDDLYGGDDNDILYGDDRIKGQTPASAHGSDTLHGDTGNDTLIGGGRGDALFGGRGDDKLYGDEGTLAKSVPLQYNGNDTLDGGEGNDLLKGQGGNDLLIGGAGRDTLFGDDDVATVALNGHGRDTLSGGEGNDYLDGQGSDDVLDGGVGDDTLVGGLGDDRLDGGSGWNVLMGGDGNDTITVRNGDLAFGGKGSDTFLVQKGVDASTRILDFSDGWDGRDKDFIVLQQDLNLTGMSRQGNDLLLALEDGSTTRVSDYYTTFLVEEKKPDAGVYVVRSDGNGWGRAGISQMVSEAVMSFTGTSAGERVIATKGEDVIFGGAGADQITGREGDDSLDGGEGDDLVLGDLGNDTLYGGDGADILSGGAGTDALTGGRGADVYRFSRGSGQDQIVATSAEDAASDIVQLGEDVASSDVTITVQAAGLLIAIKGTADTLFIASHGEDANGRTTYAAAELRFSSGTSWDLNSFGTSPDDDIFSGDEGNNSFSGFEGNDSIYGLGGNDTMSGGSGRDLLDGGTGDDDMLGGSGNDVLFGGAGNDRLGGEDQLNPQAVSSFTGDDSLHGGDGADLLLGGRGDDVLHGDGGADRLYGGDGKDVLRGGEGVDHTDGGLGDDVYEFDLNDVLVGANGQFEELSDGGGQDLLNISGVSDTMTLAASGTNGDALLSIDDEHKILLRGAALGAIDVVSLAGQLFSMDRLMAERFHGALDLTANASNMRLYGGATGDVLTVGEAASGVAVSGGRGNDLITLATRSGGTVLFSEGDGTDELISQYDLEIDRAGDNILQLGVGLDLDDLSLVDQGGGQYLLRIGATAGQGILFTMDSLQPDGMSRPFDFIQTVGGTAYSWSDLVARGISPGTAGAELSGAVGSDTLLGGVGVDFLDGAAGDDELHGGAAHDDLYGGSGRDLLFGDGGNDSLFGGWGQDTLYGGSGNDLLMGDDAFNEAPDSDADDGNSADSLFGGQGNDTLLGGDGIDYLEGEEGNDLLLGGNGQDVLFGGSGRDTLRGGDGKDALFFGGGGVADGGTGDDGIGGNLAGVDVIFDVGGGWDVIQGSGPDLGGARLFLGEGFSSGSLSLSRPGWTYLSSAHWDLNLLVAGTPGGDQVKVQQFFSQESAFSPASIEEVVFFDGTRLSYYDLLRRTVATVNGTFQASGASDEMVGGQGADTLYGNDGSDTIWGAEGNDAIYGGALHDDLRGGAGDDVVYGGDDSDRVAGNTGSDRLFGELGNDWIDGGDGDDTLDGGQGDDQLSGGRGADVYRWGIGQGNDWIARQPEDTSADRIEILAGASPASLRGFRARSSLDLVLSLGNGNETLTIQDFFTEANQFRRNGRIVFADGGSVAASDIVSSNPTATEGDDTLWGFDNDDFINGGGGNDSITGGGGRDTLFGGAGDDFVEGNGSATTVVDGGEGNDTVVGHSGDVLIGGVGDDLIYADGALVRFGRGDGHDVVSGANGTRIELEFDSSEAKISTSGASVQLTFEGSDDVLELDGYYTGLLEPGNDNLEIEFGDGVVWSSGQFNTVLFAGSDQDDMIYGLYGSDVISGGQGNDTIFGSIGDDTLLGGEGNDVLRGEGGDDYLVGGAGDDEFDGREGADTIVWGHGAGSDRTVNSYDYAEVDVDTVFVNARPDEVNVGILSFDLRLSIEGTADTILLIGGHRPTGDLRFNPADHVVFADGTVWDREELMRRSMLGSSADDVIYGFETSDLIQGRGGNDDLVGQEGDDTIYGGAGSDGLTGGAGNDLLVGGTGDDTLVGHDGDDRFVFGLGDGRDVFFEAPMTVETAVSGTDTLQFGAGIGLSDLTVVRSGDSAFIHYSQNDRIELGSYYGILPGSAHAIDRIEFANGQVLEGPALYALLDAPVRINQAPTVVATIPALKAKQDSPFSFALPSQMFSDSDPGASITTEVWNLPGWLTFNPNSGVLSGTPGSAARGTYDIGVDARDEYGATATSWITLTVGAANKAPRVSQAVADRTIAIGAPWSFVVPTGAFTDPDSGDTLTYEATRSDGGALPNWLTFNPVTRTFAGTPIEAAALNVRITARDAWGGSVTDDFVLTAAALNLTLNGTSGADTLVGGWGNDSLNGAAGNDNLSGGRGDDRLDGGTGNDIAAGGEGDDTYLVDSASDVVTEFSNEGYDSVQSSATFTLGANVEALTLTGTSGISGTGNGLDNLLTGNSANNTLTGGAGNDVLSGGLGNDTMFGGAGSDTYVVNVSTDVVTELSNEGIDSVQSAVSWVLGDHVEHLTLTGTATINGTGNALDNWLVGNSANNTLTGGGGNDTLDGGLGNDAMVGGAGDDTYVVNVTADAITEAANEGTDTVQAAIAWTLATNLENLTLTGTANVNGTGNTVANVLLGNEGNNALYGLAGNDTLDGGRGNDTLVGAAGADTYRFSRGHGVDTVQDNDSTAGVKDRVEFALGIVQSDLTFSRSGNSLVTSVNGTADQLVVQDWYIGVQYRVEEFRFADGGILTDSQVQGLVSAMAAFSAGAGGAAVAPTMRVPSHDLAVTSYI